ncbi:hypothetical protein ASPVEDRAFT_88297 [Aspergillus versicolor CBS 583.65]|uniref:Uncharacterized protein n=1 Tax=Aspergillus versicolor CBS 583.65 TaxID=1036611 RepID=A0A1L9PZS7_ASPVE|nr:uncharacterized protein ASPVEDRAFT_88297 [Aspergillus versicolor CBS 583.65]OJJ07031.1 hypothetical protein ASPVEDRAFT_88297 [Aspergillus versicolor CBS 583.65]
MKYTRLPTLPVFTEPGTPAESRAFIAYKAVAATALFSVSFFLGVVFDKVVGGNKASVAHCGDYGSINSFPDGTISQVCLSSHVNQRIRHYPEFEAPPPESGPEPVWDALIPDGLGYIVHPDLSPNTTSVVAVFHQLHCLYLIRRSYYTSTPDSQGKDFDTGIDRHPHVGHCFDYLRQSLLCSADSSLEPTNERVNGNPRWGFDRQCRDYEDVRRWAEKWRAFDIEGSFVPFHLEHDS